MPVATLPSGDTAGLRKVGGKIEKAGIESSKAIISKSNLILWLFDSSKKSYKKELEEDIKSLDKQDNLLLANKIDLVKNKQKEDSEYIYISCTNQDGFDELINKIVQKIESKSQTQFSVACLSFLLPKRLAI